MSNTGWVVTIIVIIIILGGGWWWYSSMQAPAPATQTTAVANGTDTGTADNGTGDNTVPAPGNTTVAATIHFTASGFSPKTVTIQKGQGVTWVDDTQSPMWVASDSHPTHTGYDGTDRTTHCAGNYTGPTPFDECQSGPTYTFVFGKTGSFDFHNHDAAQFEGTVVVQ